MLPDDLSQRPRRWTPLRAVARALQHRRASPEEDVSHRVLGLDMTPEQILDELLATEREAHDLLERAARLTSDPEERELFERLARREEDALHELEHEKDRLDAELFVQRALDC
jgi:hypothetical protein